MMNLITVTFELIQQKQIELIQMMEELSDFWNEKGFTVSLFRETTKQNCFVLLLLSEKHVDDLTILIQNEPKIRDLFQRLRESESRVVISSMEQIV